MLVLHSPYHWISFGGTPDLVCQPAEEFLSVGQCLFQIVKEILGIITFYQSMQHNTTDKYVLKHACCYLHKQAGGLSNGAFS
jgi:hypothetical protein